MIAILIVIGGCTTARLDRGLTREAAALLGEAANLRFPEAVPVLLALAEESRALGDLPKAQAAVDRLRAFPLEPTDRVRAELLGAHVLLDRKQPDNALAALDALDALTVPPSGVDRMRFGQLRATALTTLLRHQDAALERSRLHPLLGAGARPSNAQALLDSLGNLSPADLTALRSDERGFLPWVELAKLLYGGAPLDQQIQRYKTWEGRWGNTIAAADLPREVREMTRIDAARPTRVGLLLPASGTLAAPARAVRDGFFAAMMEPGAKRPEIAAYDVQTGGVVAAYERAVADGMQVVIGPLDKQDVVRLNAHNALSIPVLALNYLPEGTRAARGLYQFGLAPEDEGVAIADQLRRAGKQRVLLVHQRADWSTRAASAFTTRWQAAGQRLVQTAVIGDVSATTTSLAAALGEPDALTRRGAIGSTFGLAATVDGAPLDAIVVLLRAADAAMIVPALRAYVGTPVAMYASSHINSAGPSVTSELDGLQFCDTPWRVYGDPLRTRIARQWPAANGETGNLYALGADAFFLFDRLALLGRRGAKLDGLTGVLTLDDKVRIVRSPSWARFTITGSAPVSVQ